jgi:hypothetical protein
MQTADLRNQKDLDFLEADTPYAALVTAKERRIFPGKKRRILLDKTICQCVRSDISAMNG